MTTGIKLFAIGLTLIEAGTLLPIPAVVTVGQVIMVIGCLLIVFNK